MMNVAENFIVVGLWPVKGTRVPVLKLLYSVNYATVHHCLSWCANSPRVAKLHFLPRSGQLLASDFLSIVDVMSHNVVPIFRIEFH
jgi:hypothetical protein